VERNRLARRQLGQRAGRSCRRAVVSQVVQLDDTEAGAVIGVDDRGDLTYEDFSVG
jgi:hypothetical protein